MKLLTIIIFLSIPYSQNCDQGFTYFEDVPISTTSIPFGINCFSDSDIQFLNDLNNENNLQYQSPIEIGTQTWFDGRLNNFVAGYYTSGVNSQISIIPTSISNLEQLRTLYMEWNLITSLPSTFSQLSELRNLYISNNQLESIIHNIGDLINLKILDLGYNNIEIIPNSLTSLDNLEYLWLFNNNITTLPEDICDMNINWNDLDGLAYPYFAIGGNQLCENVPTCISASPHFTQSLDQFYYSFMYEINQECGSTDVNDDGIWNILDVVLTVNFIMGNISPTTDEFNSADFNNDGVLNVLDIVQMVNYIVEN